MIPEIVSQGLISDGLALYLYLSLVSQDHELQTKLKETKDIQSFAQVAVQLAEERGYHFDSQEIEALLNDKKVNAEKANTESIEISDNLLLAGIDYYTSNWNHPACQGTATDACREYLRRLNIDPYTSNSPNPACNNTATGDCENYKFRVSHGIPIGAESSEKDDCYSRCDNMVGTDPNSPASPAQSGCYVGCSLIH